MRFFRSITFQIWAPYAAVFFILALGVVLYYPSLQYDVLRDQKRDQLNELARAIAVGIELSLDAGNFAGLEKTVGFFAASEEEVSVLVFTPGDNPLQPEMITFFPLDIKPQEILFDSVNYFRVKQPFQSASFSGTVEVVIPERYVGELVWNLNFPVYILVAIIFIFSVLLFYVVARRVSKPISELTEFSRSLIDPAFTTQIDNLNENEIGVLRNSLITLRNSLNEQRDVNKKLLDGLETEVKLRTNELRSAVEKLKQAQASAKLGHFTYWFSTDRVELSENLLVILGLDTNELENLNHYLKLFNESGKNQLRPVFKSSDKPGYRFSLDLRLADNVVWVTVSGQVRHDDRTGELFIAGTIQDITDRKAAEAEVNKLSLVAKLSTNGIIITDKQRRMVWANQSTERLTGYSLSELIGQSPKMFQFEQTDPAAINKIRLGLLSKQKIRVEILNRSKTGRPYWVELHIEPFFDEFGNLEGYLAIEVDITERKSYEDELKNALEKEKEINQLKSRFITMTSHEFRTPLTTIQSNAELLFYHFKKIIPNTEDKAYRFIGRMNSEIIRLTSLMNDILLLGRVDSGKLDFKPVPSNADQLLIELISQHQFVKNDDRVIDLQIKGTPRAINLDQGLFTHIMSNLLSNALKYSPGKPSPRCMVEFHKDKLTITVVDFGVGIPNDELPKVFESFHRAKNVENIQGTGLGLQIVKQFVEMHQGRIELSSREGEGTTVIVEFPDKQSRENNLV